MSLNREQRMLLQLWRKIKKFSEDFFDLDSQWPYD